MNKTILSSLILTLSVLNSVRADSVLVFNEVMYHPATNEPAMEWVELRNQFKNDLGEADWHNLAGDVMAVGPNASKTDSTVGGVVQRFYRIIEAQ